MADRPILFSGPMVRAILDGRKSQTRRVLKLAKGLTLGDLQDEGERDGSTIRCARHQVQEPPYEVGDRLWVREAWSDQQCLTGVRIRDRDPAQCAIWYWADGNPSEGDYEKPRPSIHMPRWASRLTLIVTDVRVQRLKELSRDDALAEGLIRAPYAPPLAREMGVDWGFAGDDRYGSPVSAFAALWDSLNADRAPWDSNPWVCAITFTVRKSNIDQLEAENG